MSARIAPAIAPFSEKVQSWLDRTMPAGVAPLVLFTTLARDERLFKKLFAGGLLDRGNLTLRQREIVIGRTTALCRSEYEWGVHVSFFAGRVGLAGEHLRSLVHGGAEDPCWNEGERVLLRLCDELHQTCSLSDQLWTELRQQHSEQAVLELLMLAGFYRTISYLTNALQLPLETFAARFPAQDSTPDAERIAVETRPHPRILTQ
jgi:alkylhydroperoxidase family enzyme